MLLLFEGVDVEERTDERLLLKLFEGRTYSELERT
jgi:hypothetical protein